MKKRKKRRRSKAPLFVLILLVLLVIYIFRSNTRIGLTTYTFSSPDLPAEFDGFRILQVSDLHDAVIGDGNCDLIALARASHPDIIAITGDFIDSNRPDMDNSLSVAGALAEIAPVYYVTGNHEARLSYNSRRAFINGLEALGVYVLTDRGLYISRNNSSIQIAGLDDIGMYYKGSMEKAKDELISRAAFPVDENAFTILLSHRPELIDAYSRISAQLVLCGHAHGGQIRLPFIGGLYSPGQGLFPEYTGGSYSNNGITMIVSRGIGNSRFPLRVFNNPELVVIEFHT